MSNFIDYNNATDLMTGIGDRIDRVTWTGTTSEWAAEQHKDQYDLICITDDGGTGLVIDSEPTPASPNPVASGGVYTALAGKANTADLGTAAAKDYTDNVRPNSHDLVESNAVFSAINNAMSSIYHVRGDITCAELTASLLVAANVGNIYELSDSGVTTALFIQGAGETLNVGDNVGIIQAGESTYLFNHMAGAFDMHDYQKKDLDTPLTIGGTQKTTVEGALGGLNDYADDIKDSVNNENILLNPFFTINLNDKSSYNGGGETFTSWVLSGATNTVAKSGDVVTLTKGSGVTAAAFYQRMEPDKYYGKTLTASILLSNGTIRSGSGVVNASASTTFYSGDDLDIRHDSGNAFIFSIKASSLSFLAVKLEEGLISTLKNDVKPQYALELARCQTATPTSGPASSKKGVLLPSDVNNKNGAKNLFPVKSSSSGTTVGGVTYWCNSDGTITTSGTSTGWSYFDIILDSNEVRDLFNNLIPSQIYKLNGTPDNAPAGVNIVLWNDGEVARCFAGQDTPFTKPSTVSSSNTVYRVGVDSAGVNMSGLTFKPMVRLASDGDPTYAQYAPTNREAMTYKANGRVGAKNLCPIQLVTQTIEGVTYTVNSDGSITASGTCGSDANSYFNMNTYLKLPAGSYILSGAPDGLATSTGYIYIDSTEGVSINYGGKPTTFLVESGSTNWSTHILILKGKTVNATFYPMIRVAEDTDNTWAPYAATNRQLTENEIVAMDDLIAGDGIVFTGINAHDRAKVVRFRNGMKMIYGLFTVGDKTAITNNLLLTVPEAFRMKSSFMTGYNLWTTIIPWNNSAIPTITALETSTGKLIQWTPLVSNVCYCITPIMYY